MSKERKKDITKYAIGDSLFRYVEMGGLFEFKVIGIRVYGPGEQTARDTQLEVEAQSCAHGWKCRVLVAQDDYGKLVSIGMLNEDEDDPQRYWHTQGEYYFYPTKGQAQNERLTLAVRGQEGRVKEAQERLNREAAQLKDLKEMLALNNKEHLIKEQS